MVESKGLIFKDVPDGWPEIGKHIAVESRDFNLHQIPPAGGFTAKVHYISFDPAQRGRMRRPEVKSYSPAFEIGKPIKSNVSCRSAQLEKLRQPLSMVFYRI